MEEDLFFAVLAVFPESYVASESLRSSTSSGDGIILLFDVNDPVPVASWLVKKVFFLFNHQFIISYDLAFCLI